MARSTRAAELGLVAVTIEGGLIAPEQVQKIVSADRTAKTGESYACPKGTSLGDEIARYFRIGQYIWKDYDRIEAPTVTQTAQFTHDLLTQCFGFTDLSGPVEHRDGTRRYCLAWEAKQGRVPVVAAAPVIGADAFNRAQPEFGDGEGGRPRRSPVSLLQDWLNAADHALWGLVFAGDRVRLMRDNASLTRPAWIEADFGAMFRDEMFADFTAWWLLTHATRFGAAGAAPSESPLESWREEGMKQGIQARADLRKNVEEALFELGQGLVEANPQIAERIRSGELPIQSLFEELLRTVYRLIFLAVAEDRDLLHPRGALQAARSLYASSYSFTFWRERSRRRVARDAHHDAWEAVKVTLANLEHGEELLGLPALGGLFARDETLTLNEALIPNRRFLAAVFCLGFIRKNGITHRINWRDLKTEELGSVYESLLEIRPRLEPNGAFTLDNGAKGNDRKTSGSYYTPDSLVETLLDSALDPALQQAEDNAGTPGEKIAAILDLKVIDPACGSGHFLLGAARRMADRVAKLRNEDAGKEENQIALRDVVSRCIHGVDRNPMAVELAKVALWIESVSPGQPLGFLDANLRCGDALLGVFDLAALEGGIPDEAYKALTGDSKEAANHYKRLNRMELSGQGAFDWKTGKGAMPPARLAANLSTIKALPEHTVAQVEEKKRRFEAWRQDPARHATRVACHLYMAAFLLPKSKVPANDQRGVVPTTADVRQKLAGGNVYGPLEGAAVDVAEAARVLHWPLAFPDVMIARGGFDVVLGNPPWERIKLQEQEFFAGTEIADAPNAAARGNMIAGLKTATLPSGAPDEYRRGLHAAFEMAKRVAEASTVFFTSPKNEDPTKLSVGQKPAPSRRYPWTGRGDVNTYALFAEHFLNLTRKDGRSGVIVPTGIATDATTAPFFSHLVSSRRLISLYSAYEVRQWFKGTDDRKSFCFLTIGNSTSDPQFVFNFVKLLEIQDARRRFSLSPVDISRINPNTKTAPTFRTGRDAELTAAIYNRMPVLIEEAHRDGNPWGVSFMTMLHMANDSALFRTAEQLVIDGYRRAGTDWVRERAPEKNKQTVLADAQVRSAPDLLSSLKMDHAPLLMSGDYLERYVPLYEAKLIHHFDHRWATYDGDEVRNVSPTEKISADFEVTARYWVPEYAVSNRINVFEWKNKWLMGWRDISLSSVERTVILSSFPLCAVNHKLPLFKTAYDARKQACLLANLSSLTLDFIARQKLSGSSLTYFYLKQFPILPPRAYSEADLAFIVPRVLELSYTSQAMAPFARDLGYKGPPFRWDEDRRATLRAELDAWYALAYGLSRDELRYVLDPKDVMGADYPSETFRVLQNNEKKQFREYRTQRLVLAAYDTLVGQGVRLRLEGYR
jgi:hypothetical protein